MAVPEHPDRIVLHIAGADRPGVTARLMETWAHGLDVRTALGLPIVDTEILRHIAWLSHRALPYAFSFAGREPPPAAIRVELTSPDGRVTIDEPTPAPDDPYAEPNLLMAGRGGRFEEVRPRGQGRPPGIPECGELALPAHRPVGPFLRPRRGAGALPLLTCYRMWLIET